MTPAEEHVIFYRELGLAMAQWSQVERALYLLASLCFSPNDRHIFGMGFVGIEGFRSKLQFTDKAVTRTIAGRKIAAEWPDLFERVSTQSGMRNKLAHNQIRQFLSANEGRRWAVSPWYAPKGTDKTKPAPGSLCVIEIIKVRLEFAALTIALRNFAARACKLQEPFPKSDERPPDPPTIHQITRQIHEELGHPQKSSREKRLEESALNAAASLLISEEKDDGTETENTLNPPPKISETRN